MPESTTIDEPTDERQADRDHAEPERPESAGEQEDDNEADDAGEPLADEERGETPDDHPPALRGGHLLHVAHASRSAPWSARTSRLTRAASARVAIWRSSAPSIARRSRSGSRR